MSRVAVCVAVLVLVSCSGGKPPDTQAPGADKSAKTRTLETGSLATQTDAPPDQLNVYLSGFHPMKKHPSHQMEAHHFCRQVNEDFAQCALFDGNTKDANLNGVEYIISEKLFESLPTEEKQYWHPHNYEILSGQLVAPGVPDVAEKELMRMKMNSYGKTWHVWMTGAHGKPGDKLPLGEAMLAWSFNRDGEAQPGLVEERDKRQGINPVEKRQQRQEFVSVAKPQMGVDALKGQFDRPTKDIPGVAHK